MDKIIKITQSAAEYLKKAIEEGQNTGVRIDIVSGGCSGMTYEVNFVKEANPSDVIQHEDGFNVFIAAKAVMFVNEMILDFAKTPMGCNLIFENPNAKSRCSCGKSFSTDSSPCCSGKCCS
ncbi:MAG: iron-sulfur cluster assembly accessory protein [Alphaproteobacteria bacterium]|nr:iron-sulfur cluster assembly accessory protein [Alphaproteobacteria bacterium]